MSEPYRGAPQLSTYYLEESYVLAITADLGQVSFAIDLVLTPEHTEYRAPIPTEQYCYRRGTIEFSGVTWLLWGEQGAPPARDASGEADHGNIDAFQCDGGRFFLEGAWGHMEVEALELSVSLSSVELPPMRSS